MSQKKQTKTTVFDVLIVMAIIAVIAYVAYTLIISPLQNRGVNRKLEFTIEMTSTTREITSLVHEGDVVTISGRPGGVVNKVEIKDSKKINTDLSNGDFVNSPVPERYDLYVTVRADAVETDTEIRAGGTEIRLGASASAEGAGYSVSGYIFDMKFLDESDGDAASE